MFLLHVLVSVIFLVMSPGLDLQGDLFERRRGVACKEPQSEKMSRKTGMCIRNTFPLIGIETKRLTALTLV